VDRDDCLEAMRIILFLFASLSLSVEAANYYTRTTSQGSGNGSDWNNAFSMSQLNTKSLSAGDTVWIAGGTYTTGLSIDESGSSGNYITFKGCLSSDAVPTAAAGWNASFACDVTRIQITPGSGGYPMDFNASWVIVDGRTNNIETTTIAQRRNNELYTGWKAKYDNTADAFLGAVVFNTSGVHDCIVTNIEGCGPGTGTYASTVDFNYQGDNAALQFRVTGSQTVTNILVSHCIFHSSPNIVRNEAAGVKYITIEHCVLYDNMSSNASIHENLIYHFNGSYWTLRFNDFTGWQVEGILMYHVGNDNAPHWIYGNIFHDTVDSGATCFWPGDDTNIPQGPLYLYNNTFVNVTVTSNQGRSWDFSASSICRNNIFYGSSMNSASDFSGATASHNWATGTAPGTSGVSSGTAPFVDLAGYDFHIVSTVSSTKPRDKGTALTEVLGASTTWGNPESFATDLAGVARGQGGGWDMGAFEFDEGGGGTTGGSGATKLTIGGNVTIGGQH
jgi:hypothetical protein